MKYGIVDTKAYPEYNLPIDHRTKMAHEYITRYKKYTHEGREFDLCFFAYISGGFSDSIQNSFDKLLQKTDGINGSYITAVNFMKMLRRHKDTQYTTDEVIQIFSVNKEITADIYT